MPRTIGLAADGIDLSPRYAVDVTVDASPTAATETVIANVTLSADMSAVRGVLVHGFAAFTVGTAGVSAQLRIRQTSVTGTVVADTGAVTQGVVAAGLDSLVVDGLDTASTLPGQKYVLTLTVASATAASTVSNVCLTALAI